MRKKLVNLAKKNKFIRKTFRFLYNNLNKFKYYYFKLRYKTDDKVIFFESYGGRSYNCSPKAIYEKMITLKEFNDYKFIWAFKDINNSSIIKDNRLKIIRSKSKDYYKYLSIAKYWIINSIIEESVTKKKGQIYVQCWHGTPLKKLRYDIEVNGSVLNSIEEIRKRNDIDAKRFDYFISPSKFATEKFISAFNLKALNKEDIIVEKGYPRNDYLFNKTKKDINNIKKKLNIPFDKKVLLYLPTFRDNQHTSGIGYTYKLEIDFHILKKRLGNNYIVLFGPHYFVANKINLDKYKNFVINVAGYNEINELYLISDIIITDYSSVFFDFANLKKPILYYMYDLDDYQNNLRDFYIDINTLPGPISKNQDDLIDNIINIDQIKKKYKNIYDEFNNTYNYLDDGNASIRVIKEIFKDLF